jgi:hypothetical protein
VFDRRLDIEGAPLRKKSKLLQTGLLEMKKLQKVIKNSKLN